MMGAIVAVLNESLTESIRGFYKLRKAYLTLNAILEEENEILAKRGRLAEVDSSSQTSDLETSTEKSSTEKADDTLEGNDKPDKGDEFYDTSEKTTDKLLPEYVGHLDLNGSTTPDDRSFTNHLAPINTSTLGERATTENADLVLDPNADIFKISPADEFIHSGCNMCFGILLILLSVIPPTFASLLKIIGFSGDRERGIRMLWAATHYPNVNGAIAGLMLLGYYHGIMGLSDILPLTGPTSYPKEKCRVLLEEMRARFPDSRLWLLEHARALASSKKLEDAMDILKQAEGSALKQVDALQWFERSLDSMYLHDYEGCSTVFQKVSLLFCSFSLSLSLSLSFFLSFFLSFLLGGY